MKKNIMTPTRIAKLFAILFATALAAVSSNAASVNGYASVSGNGVSTTTGGGKATPVKVTTAAEFIKHATSSSPAVIRVMKSISLGSSAVDIKSNKTIIGDNSGVTLTGQLNVRGPNNNIIISYINITNSQTGSDCLQITGKAHHVWVDHCTITEGRDGLCDITKGADFITVSWVKFSYSALRAHNFPCLISSSDTDEGPFRITWHHNWWGDNCKQRQPCVKHGNSHIYNCYWNSKTADYCSQLRLTSKLLSQNNYFDGVKNPLQNQTNASQLKTVGNVFKNCSGAQDSGNGNISVPYSYSLDPANNVPSIVKSGAGNVGSR